MRKSGFLERQRAERQALVDIGLQIGRQQTIDFIQIALQKNGWGKKRLYNLLEDMKLMYKEFELAFDIKHPECDYYRELLDRALSQGCGKEHPLIPFSERYETLKSVNYGGKKK